VATLARAQVRAGWHVTICTTDVGTPRSRRAPVEIPGLEICVFRNLFNKLAWDDITIPLGLASWARHHAHAFDAVHLHGHRHLGAWWVARARRPSPYVLSPHGTATRIERRIGLKRIFDRAAGDGILQGAARVLAVSDVEASQLLSLGILEEHIARVPNAVDPESILPLPGRGAFRKRHGIPADAPVVLFLGRVTRNKRVDVLLRAVASIPKVVLVVAGPDGGEICNVRGEAALFKVSSRIRITGALDTERRREALADADVLALPSEQEIFGLASMEGLLAGVAPVVSEGTGCAERIRAWDSGWVIDAGSVDALRNAIEEALHDPEERLRRAALGAEAVRAELAPASVAARILDIYREVAR
jgi:glycosyltransferase involved in cell wall biosynthesis